jgi:hypothetical protein
MTAIAAFPVCRTGAGKGSARAARRVEKIRAREHFDGEYETPYEPPCRIHQSAGLLAACQTGTGTDAFFWDGPRLRSAFAAQVLGQALGVRQQVVAMRGAYGGARLRLVASIDQRI